MLVNPETLVFYENEHGGEDRVSSLKLRALLSLITKSLSLFSCIGIFVRAKNLRRRKKKSTEEGSGYQGFASNGMWATGVGEVTLDGTRTNTSIF